METGYTFEINNDMTVEFTSLLEDVYVPVEDEE